MIEVKIIENNGLVALVTITGDNVEFNDDLLRLKRSVLYTDREFIKEANPPYWRIRKASRYANAILEIGDAIKLHFIMKKKVHT